MESFGTENTPIFNHSMASIQIVKHERLMVIHLHDIHLLLWINLYGGCAAGHLVIYIKKTASRSV